MNGLSRASRPNEPKLYQKLGLIITPQLNYLLILEQLSPNPHPSLLSLLPLHPKALW